MTTKNNLKRIKYAEQDGKCAITGLPLPEDPALFDLDRLVPGSEGGKYEENNVRAILPQAHRDLHDNKPSDSLGVLRNVMREYRIWQRLLFKIQNHRLAAKRQMGELSESTEAGFDFILVQPRALLKQFQKQAEKSVKRVGLPIVKQLLAQKGLGSIYAAEIITTLDPAKADTPSAFWAYTGYHGDSRNRYKKGEKGGGNKAFRSVMFNLGMNFLKNKNPFYELIYRRYRERLDNSQKLVHHKGKMANGKVTSGKDIPWCETNPGRRHLASLRYMMKHFLADLWRVWRGLEGLPITKPYPQETLGHSGFIAPSERGWE